MHALLVETEESIAMSGKIAQGAKDGAFRVSLMIEKCGADMLLGGLGL